MSKLGINYLDDAIDRAVEYCSREFDMTYAEIVGELEIYKARIIQQAFEEEGEDEDDT